MTEVDVILALRKRLQEAIDACDFATAKKIDLQIKNILEVEKNNKSTTTLKAKQNNYDKAKEKCRFQAVEYFKEASEAITKCRENYQTKIAEIQNDYASKVAVVQDEFSKDFELCTIRADPVADAMKKSAQVLARERQFDTASIVFNESEQKRNRNIGERQDTTVQKYEEIRKNLQKSQEKEEKIALRYLQRDLHNVDKKYKANINQLLNALKACASKNGIKETLDQSDMFPKLIIEEIEGMTFSPPLTPESKTSPKTISILSKSSVSATPTKLRKQ
ncbi:hypothetical protein TVAG_202130 [Trichomonas vaginalis G3]|uniref:F-BAR domain-containing protein n=1 Tax=Trichomonas vaginalis (strain ATCC PRA-98 / G3) TaxID=412133 RepID=A2DWN4_TRIV3|nr:hypothetical protein TVAGG3_0201590 [Trichomonas vaginalis G3]EAY15219.1 hypothetical protein TVAG_202130 [Trichomonas vaginalis G3]KAI5550627.1 hypothetical protein TVAGG3_0201590 [Trichomonas vaginalis G3]|eukprot:XP_001327442.1 hypothetical protein [Trichomonas vaginalis G3]